ncbi:MAG: hypothetical protein OEV41_01625 [Gammaproteobacteria bacterium]|nr:hypothetical protein [Gammaproteobacteria bacterium]MDH5344706.1 hypothetical protein [Gammaproteobacteria bacterium]
MRSKAIRVLLLLLASGPLSASPLFESEAVLEVQIEGPFGRFIDERYDREELPFVLRTDGEEYAVGLRSRGKSRMRACTFPPIRLDFDAAAVSGTLFEGQDKLKLVTHCLGGPSGQANVMEEYSAYKVFNLLSDTSYRVRPLKVTYTDTDGEHEELVSNAFLLESDVELAARVGGSVVQLAGVRKSMLNRDQAAIVYIFQYLIANTDWSLIASAGEEYCCHNGGLVGRDGELYYVPFDFDLSGLVDARYAKPDPSLRITKVTSRYYRGYCIEPESLAGALASINAKQAEILAVFDSIPGLGEKDANSAKRFLDRFFREAENEKKLVTRFERSCVE